MLNTHDLNMFLMHSKEVVCFEQLPPVKGLYLIRYLLDGEWLPLYLGKSNNLLARWKSHHRMDEVALLKNLGIPINIRILVEAPWAAFSVPLEDLERMFIGGISPKLNQQRVTVPLIDIEEDPWMDEDKNTKIADPEFLTRKNLIKPRVALLRLRTSRDNRYSPKICYTDSSMIIGESCLNLDEILLEFFSYAKNLVPKSGSDLRKIRSIASTRASPEQVKVRLDYLTANGKLIQKDNGWVLPEWATNN